MIVPRTVVLGFGLLVCGLLSPSARAQNAFAWSRATIRMAPEGQALDAGTLRSWRDDGIDAVVWTAGSGSEGTWGAAVTAARSGDVRILFGMPGGVDEVAATELVRLARTVGFDGVLAASRSSWLPGAEDDEFPVLSAFGDDPSVRSIPGLPATMAGLDSLFAGRARTAEHPDPAPVAMPASPVGASWLLMPGPVVVPGEARTDELWATVARFRADHPAVADGLHEKLADEPYVFYRGMRIARDETDEVVVVLGAGGRVRLNVASVFPDDVVVRDAVTGRIGLVSFGQVTFEADASGLILLELVD